MADAISRIADDALKALPKRTRPKGDRTPTY